MLMIDPPRLSSAIRWPVARLGEPDSLEVRVNDLVPIRLLLFQRRLRRGHPCVVDENVNGTESLLGRRERRVDALGRSDVHRDALRLTFFRADLLDGLLDRLGPARRDRHPRAAPGEKDGEILAEPTGGAGHERMPAFDRKQIAHLAGSPLPSFKVRALFSTQGWIGPSYRRDSSCRARW